MAYVKHLSKNCRAISERKQYLKRRSPAPAQIPCLNWSPSLVTAVANAHACPVRAQLSPWAFGAESAPQKVEFLGLEEDFAYLIDPKKVSCFDQVANRRRRRMA